MPLTGTHLHLMHERIPVGGPKSGVHWEPSSYLCLPKTHSERKCIEYLKSMCKTQEGLKIADTQNHKL